MDADGITHIPSFACALCGHTMDAIGETTGELCEPGVGDVCGCIACGCPMVFIDPHGTGILQLRPMTDAEVAGLSTEQQAELARIRAFAQQVMRVDHVLALRAKLN